MNEKGALIAMNGSAESALAASKLKEKRFEVVGVTLLMFDAPDGAIPEFVNEAKVQASVVGIEHKVVDVRKKFKETVLAYFVDEYKHGRTPNPCIICNEQLKWFVLREIADELNCHWMATGHYARLMKKDEFFYASKAAESQLDQSHTLYRLPQEFLLRAIFPIGHLSKHQVMVEANKRNFIFHNKITSVNKACFMYGLSSKAYLSTILPEAMIREGSVYDRCGVPIGKHQGVAFYAQGQRKDLELDIDANWCVVDVDTEKNAVFAGPQWVLEKQQIELQEIHLINPLAINSNQIYQVNIGGNEASFFDVYLEVLSKSLIVRFLQPIWNVRPGQSVVIYDGDCVIGGGIYKK